MRLEDFNLAECIRLARIIRSDSSELEIKSASAGLSKNIAETISAFANKSGGMIVCGLSEKDNFHPAAGFDAKKISDVLAQTCSDKMEPPVRVDIRVLEFEQAPVVVGYIPETAPYAKPCYVKARGLYDGSFIRSGDGDRKLSRYEVDRLSEERTQPFYDKQLVYDALVSDLDVLAIQSFLGRERTQSPRVFAGLSDENALLTMGVLGRGSDGVMHPTMAGILALGRHPQQFFPRANITFAVFPGKSKEDLAKNGARFLDSRTIIGAIPAMVSETLASVRRNMKMLSFVEAGARQDIFEYPETAIREAVANALMHRDYSPEGLGAQVQVNMYSDRMEIINPGGLYGIVTVDTIGQYGASSSRNQYLSRILESTPFPADAPETGYVVENKGTGFAQIQLALKTRGMLPAEPIDDISMFSLCIRKAQADACTDVVKEKTGNEIQNKILEMALRRTTVSAAELSRELGISRPTVSRHIKKLVASQALIQVGNGPATRFRVSGFNI